VCCVERDFLKSDGIWENVSIRLIDEPSTKSRAI
jgi:hypothetical protein